MIWYVNISEERAALAWLDNNLISGVVILVLSIWLLLIFAFVMQTITRRRQTGGANKLSVQQVGRRHSNIANSRTNPKAGRVETTSQRLN